MSVSNALMRAIFQRLSGDAAVVAIVGDRIKDKPPANTPAPSITFGPIDIRYDDPDCLALREVYVQLDLWSEAQDGRREINDLADAVKASLHRWRGLLDQGALIFMEIERTSIVADPDGITLHGIMEIHAEVEE